VEAARLSLSASPGWGRPRLGALLLRDGHLTAQQLEEALTEQAETGRRLGEILLERHWIASKALAQVLAEQHGLEFIELNASDVDPEAVTLLPEKFAQRYRALPVRFLSNELVLIAVSDPTDVLGTDDLRLAVGVNVRFAVAERMDLDRAISHFYRIEGQLEVVESRSLVDEQTGEDIRDLTSESSPAVQLVNSLLARAIDEGASDLHFEPQAKHMVVRARIDGIARKLTTIPKAMQASVTSRLKIMGELDIAERRLPQDGRVSIRVGGQGMDLRMAVLPTSYGEKVILRINHGTTQLRELSELGMGPEAEETFKRAIMQPYGAIFTVGPTGSGKTTTLYAALGLLNEEERVLFTIEDPVEHQMAGVSQVEVNTKSGLTFARGLRTMLRADPDVVLVGEIRDEETARIAIQAALTGHLVLSTLHAHNAAASMARLKDMNVETGLLATAINCIVAQRLARRLCLTCREPAAATSDELVELGLRRADEEVILFHPRGCPDCAETGYKGRVALYEVMPIEGEVRRLIDASTEEIFEAAVRQGMKTLRDDGIRHCLAGVTSLEEVRRVTGDRLF
jgi:type IV pilus assembly protein PilB